MLGSDQIEVFAMNATIDQPGFIEIVTPKRFVELYNSQRSNIASAQVIPGQLGELGSQIVVTFKQPHLPQFKFERRAPGLLERITYAIFGRPQRSPRTI
jgi:hypothetical protein